MSDEVVMVYGAASGAVDQACTELQIACGLLPSLRDFTHNDGRVERLACLSGTIPTSPPTPDQPVYNIPVDVWFPTRFPAFPPTIYVIATSTVGIRTSPIVDSSGRVAINLPYFFWDPDTPNPAAAAVALVGAVSVAFGKAIPVYSRATGDGAPRESGVSPQDLVSRAALQRAVEKKIESRRRALETGEGSAIAQLRDVNARLRASAHELHVRQERGVAEVKSAKQATAELADLMLEIDDRIAIVSELRSTPTDDLVVVGAPLHAQMLRLVAEIAAAEDVMLTLGRGVATGAVTLPRYLKLTRAILLKQFDARVLLAKACDIAKVAYTW